MKIKNFEELASTEPRKIALEIAEAGLQAIDTKRAIQKLVRLDGSRLKVGEHEFDLEKLGKTLVFGAGKCALEAVQALEKILAQKISGGVVLYIAGDPQLKIIKAVKGTHPLPTDDNILGATAVVNNLKNLDKDDLVIFIVSGGGSTLLCLPEDKECSEESSVMTALTRAGADIREINIVRKHLSLARGGYLAKYAYPANVISLIFSDVPGDDLQFVASGPTVRDSTTVDEAATILAKYDILKTCGINGCGLVETPKEEKYFEKVKNLLAVSNKTALEAMALRAKELGLNPDIRDSALSGETNIAGRRILNELRNAPTKTALLYGGETTVTVKGHGHGGRNLELALSVLEEIGYDELIITVATDGRDNGEFAGAICDVETRNRADNLKIAAEKYLRENSEYPFFEKVGSYLMTGDTASNVSDLIVAIKT